MAYSEEIKKKVWSKGQIVFGYDSDKFRKDECGAWMIYEQYGKSRSSIFEWEIDHINPDGGDEISNLRPLQWQNNLEKSDGRLKCKVTSSGNQNIEI